MDEGLSMKPIERACRELCREGTIPEDEWRLFENTLSGALRVFRNAARDLGAEIRKALLWR